MKVFLLLALLIAIPLSTLKAAPGPYTEEEYKQFLKYNAGVLDSSIPVYPDVTGTMARKTAKVKYDFTVSGGSSVATIPLGVTIPANSIITRNYFYVVTPLVATG